MCAKSKLPVYLRQGTLTYSFGVSVEEQKSLRFRQAEMVAKMSLLVLHICVCAIRTATICCNELV